MVDRSGPVVIFTIAVSLAVLIFIVHRWVGPTVPAAHALNAAGVSLVLLMSVVGIAALVAGRRARIPARSVDRSASLSSPHTPSGFVMGTFEQLLRDLKDKEADLTRLQAEAVARAEQIESYNENILRSIASGVITCDHAGTITTFNAAAERILGHDGQTVIGRTCEQVFGLASPIAAAVTQSLADGVAVSRREWNFLRGASRITVGLSSALLRDRSERVIGAAVVFTDLTEIKQLQEQMESRRRLSVLGEMSAGIAHEFRNYMGTVVGWAKLLGNRLPQGDAGQPMVAAIMDALGTMQRLIDELLAFGRNLEPQCQIVELRKLLADGAACEHESTVRVTIALAADAPREVEWDPLLMRQALKNLVQNAIEAMPEGGCVTVDARWVSRNPDTVQVAITDTGVGIAPDVLDRIFLPFFTLKAQGHGLGLALVQKIVVAHQGHIRVQSEEGLGTTFTLTLPRVAAIGTTRRETLAATG